MLFIYLNKRVKSFLKNLGSDSAISEISAKTSVSI